MTCVVQESLELRVCNVHKRDIIKVWDDSQKILNPKNFGWPLAVAFGTALNLRRRFLTSLFLELYVPVVLPHERLRNQQLSTFQSD